jgi:hypothetical protein
LGLGVDSYLPPAWNQRNPVTEVKNQPLTFGDDFQAPSALSAQGYLHCTPANTPFLLILQQDSVNGAALLY